MKNKQHWYKVKVLAPYVAIAMKKVNINYNKIKLLFNN